MGVNKDLNAESNNHKRKKCIHLTIKILKPHAHKKKTVNKTIKQATDCGKTCLSKDYIDKKVI